MDLEKTKEFWNKAAENSYLSDKENVGMLTEGNEVNAIYRSNEEERHFLELVDLNSNVNVLEVGCGGGRWCFFLADKVNSVVGLDFSKKMIEIAEKGKARFKINNIEFFETDLLCYDSDKKFDLVYFSGVLQYLNDEDLRRTIEKAKDFLSPKGIIISRDTIQERRRVELKCEYPVIYRTIREYEELFLDAGFTMNYNALSYEPRRFSHFASRLYSLPFISYHLAFSFQSVLIWINDVLGNPRFLMQKHYLQMIDSVGARQHRFFRYVRA